MGTPRPSFSLRLQELDLHLRHTFRISRGSEDVATTLVMHLTCDGIEALGEAAPIARYEESVALAARQLERLPLVDEDLWAIDEVLDLLPARAASSRCALDLALHDLAGKRLNAPLYRLLGLNPDSALTTSFTIGIGDLDETARKVKEATRLPIIKVKLGSQRPIETMEVIRSHYRGTIRLDANEGWSPQEAVNTLAALERFDIEFCEQPVAAGHPEHLRYVRDHSRIPILVDEDCLRANDIPKLAGCVDGINIKLAKCGGLREALRMIHTARSLGLKVMLGCMIESSILATAAAHLTPLCDYADLDGPLLITDDPYSGVDYQGAVLRLPDAPGLGVAPRAVEAPV